MGQGASACFGGGMSEEKRERERIASQEARAKAAEAAERRQLQFEQSAVGRAALAQAAKEKQSTSNSGEPNLKWQMG